MATLTATSTWVFEESECERPAWGVCWHGFRYGGRFYEQRYAEALAQRLERSSAEDHEAWRELHGLAVAA